jgi:hypothetical protein
MRPSCSAAQSFLELLAQCLIARSARADRAFEAAAFLSPSQTKSVCSFVRLGQRRAILARFESAGADWRRLEPSPRHNPNRER